MSQGLEPPELTEEPVPLVYTIPEAAAILRCAVSWLEKEVRAGRAPASRFGRMWRMSMQDIDEVRARNRRQAVADPNPWGLSQGSLRRRKKKSA